MVMQLGRISRYANMAIRTNLMKSFIFLLKVVLQKLPLEGSSTDVGSMISFCFLLRSTNELNNLTKIEQHPAQYEAEISYEIQDHEGYCSQKLERDNEFISR